MPGRTAFLSSYRGDYRSASAATVDGAEKARIVAESFEEGANISEVARRNGVVRGLLTVWRQKLAAAGSLNAPGFVPVLITSEGSPATAGEPAALRRRRRCDGRWPLHQASSR